MADKRIDLIKKIDSINKQISRIRSGESSDISLSELENMQYNLQSQLSQLNLPISDEPPQSSDYNEIRNDIIEATVPFKYKQAIQRYNATLNIAQAPERNRRLEQIHIQEQMDAITNNIQSNSGTLSPQDIAAQYIRINKLSERLGSIDEEFSPNGRWARRRKETAEREFVAATRTASSSASIAESIHKISISPSQLGSIGKTARELSSTKIEEESIFQQNEIDKIGSFINEIANSDMSDSEKQEAYLTLTSQQQEHIERAGQLKGSKLEQRRTKTDLEGRRRTAEDLVSKIGKRIQKEEITETAKGANFKTEQDKLSSIQNNILSASKAFKDALDGLGGDAEKLGKGLEELGEKYEKQAALVDKMIASGSGGGLSDKIAKWSGTAGDIAEAAAHGLMQMGVVSQQREMSTTTGYADIVNRQFEDVLNASGGDMSAFRRLSTGQYDAAIARAGQLGGRARTSVGMSAGADVLKGAGVVAGEYGGIKNLFDAGNAVQRSGAAIAMYGVGSAIKTQDAAMNLTGSEIALDSFNRYMALEDASKKIFDKSTQAYRNTAEGNMMATRGAGGARGELFDQLNDPIQRRHLAKLGISTQQMQSLYQQGTSQMGAAFSGVNAKSIIDRAAELQKAGYMNAEDYMSSVGKLTETGGGKGDMENILKNAVAAGMDSSRNIQAMVGSIQGLSMQSALLGISTTAGATEAVSLAYQSAGIQALPVGMRDIAAGGMANKLSQSMKDSSLNLYNIAEMSVITKLMPDKSLAQRLALQKLDMTQLNMIGKDKKAAEAMGFGFLHDDPDLLQKIKKAEARKELHQQVGPIVGPKATAALDAAFEKSNMTWEDFSKTEDGKKYAPILASAAFGQGGNITTLFDYLKDWSSNKKVKDDVTVGKGGIQTGGNKDVLAMENIRAEHFNKMEELNTRGQNIFADVYGNLENFSKVLKHTLDQGTPEDMEKKVKDASLKGDLTIKVFDTATDKFKSAVDSFTNALRDKMGIDVKETTSHEPADKVYKDKIYTRNLYTKPI